MNWVQFYNNFTQLWIICITHFTNNSFMDSIRLQLNYYILYCDFFISSV